MIYFKSKPYLNTHFYILLISCLLFVANVAYADFQKNVINHCLAPATSLDNQLMRSIFDKTYTEEKSGADNKSGILGAEFIAEILLREIDLKDFIISDISNTVNMIKKDVQAGADYSIDDFIIEMKRQASLRNMEEERVETLTSLVNRYFNNDKQFKARNKLEEEISEYIEMIVKEHNSDLLPEEKGERMSRLMDIVESVDKFPGDSSRRPWARIIIEFEDGSLKAYIFKEETYGAMENWGYYMLKTLGINASHTRKYGQNSYLIVPIGKFNLGRVRAEQYLNYEFSGRLSYLVGRAALRAFVLGLADRKAQNMRVILDESGLPSQIINADLASAFTFSKKGKEQQAIRDVVFLLSHIIKGAKDAGMSNSDLIRMMEKFMDGFKMQLSDFHDAYSFLKEQFDKYDPANYEKATRQWYIAYQMKERKNEVLDRINPLIIKNYEINTLLLIEVLNSLQSSNFLEDDEFLTLVFRKNEFIFEKTEDLFKMFRRQGVEFEVDNVQLLSVLFDTFHNLADRLKGNHKYDFALVCYEKSDYICKLIIDTVKDKDINYWQKRREALNRDMQKVEAIVFNSQLEKNRLNNYELKDVNFLDGILGQAI